MSREKATLEAKSLVLSSLLITLAFIFHVLYLRNTIGEAIVFFLVGVLTAQLYLSEKRWAKSLSRFLFFLASATFIIATLLDPVLKPYLDVFFGVNTVSNYYTSLIGNGLVYLSFLLGFFVTEKILSRRRPKS